MKFPRWFVILRAMAGLALALTLPCATAAEPEIEAKDLPRVLPVLPDQALGTFQIKPGFKLELVAAEPLVADPIAVCFDEAGRMFVVEMRDYSERRDEHLGRVRLLEDTNGDGRFDKSTVYAEDLAWPTAVICYGGGVFVAATPDIYYLKDNTGDGVADTREVVFTGFGTGVPRLNVQQLVNSFAWGIDNRIHGANGGNGGAIVSSKRPTDKPLDLRGRDFSFDPRTLEIRAESGGGQYGMSFDDTGRKFVCSNSSHIRAVMYEDRYAANNKFLPMPSPAADIAVDGPAAEVYRISPEEPWRVIRTKWRVAGLVPGPIEGGGRASGYFTSATGITIYRGDAWPEGYRGDAFTADCGSNLVHRKRVLPDGAGYKAQRADDESRVEFLASRDLWFRPVQMANAPDGALYILDMYREVIEHPWSFPANIKKFLDLNSGNDRGRIYRVVPAGFTQRPIERLAGAPVERLIETLAHANGWHRDTAARILYERQDPASVQPLHELLRSSKSALARVHGLHVLHGLGALKAADVRAGLADSDASVRQHALRLLEELPTEQQAEAAPANELQQLAADSNPRVLCQLAFTLGFLRHPNRSALLPKIAVHHPRDPWLRAAVLNAAAELESTLAATLLADAGFLAQPDARGFLEQLTAVIGARAQAADVNDTIAIIGRVAAQDLAFSLITALGDGLRRSGSSLLRAGNRAQLDPIFKRAAQVVSASDTTEDSRRLAIRLLAHGESESVRPTLRAALEPGRPVGLQRAAIAALAAFNEPSVAADLLGAWNGLTPQGRDLVIEALLRRPERINALLDAIESGKLRSSDLSAAQVEYLRKRPDASLRDRAAAILGRPPGGTRPEVVAAYRSSLSLVADPAHGRVIYAERCATCHRLAGEGHSLGPDLESVRTNGKEALLANLLDPNREVMPKYVNYLVETKDGESFTGLVASETDAAVVLRQPNGVEQNLLRSNMALIRSLGQSAMPDGLEQGLSAQDMADLIGYVLSAKP